MSIFGLDKMRSPIIAHAHNILCRKQFHAKALRLFDDALSKLSPGDAFGKTRIVVESLSNACLPAKPAALDDQRIIAIASRVDSCRQTGRTATNHDQIIKLT